MVGGEHLVTLGSVKAAAKIPDLHIIHFDAHTDLRDDYMGEKLSHATVMRRCWEIVGDGRIFQFGIRSGEREEFLWGARHVYTNKFNLNGLYEIVQKLKNKPVYLTIDLDVLDPSIFGGTERPSGRRILFGAAGRMPYAKRANITGLDVNELCPVYDKTAYQPRLPASLSGNLYCLYKTNLVK